MIQESGRFKEGNFNVSLKKETGKNQERTAAEIRHRFETICNDKDTSALMLNAMRIILKLKDEDKNLYNRKGI